MRIAWLHTHFHHPTGATKYVSRLLAELTADHEVAAVVEDASSEVCEELSKSGIKVEVLLGTSSYALGYWAMFPWHLARLTSKLRAIRDKYDVWISTMFPMHIAARRAGVCKLVIFCFEPFAFFYDRQMVDGQPLHIRWYFRMLRAWTENEDRRVYREAEGVLTCSPVITPFIESVYGRKALSVSMGVDVDFFRPPEHEVKTKQIFHTTDYSPLKNTDDLIAAIPGILKREPDACFVISHAIGQPAVIARYQKQLEAAGCLDRVRFAGRLSEEELLRGYQESALGVYLGSGFGAAAQSLFVLEMMACGKPVVRANTTDSEVEDGKTGRLFSVHDITQFEDVVVACLRDEAQRKRMGENARREIVEKYTWRQVKENLEGFLKTLEG